MISTINEPYIRERVQGKLKHSVYMDEWRVILREARQIAAQPKRSKLLLHSPPLDLRPDGEITPLQRKKLHSIIAGEAKRYVFSIQTKTGIKIVKVFEPKSLGHRLLGFAGRSVSQKEHLNHVRCESAGLAATSTLGYLELYHNRHLIRGVQFQDPVDQATCRPLEQFFPAQLERFSMEAIPPLARAMGRMHAQGFFHNDLKSFHAYVQIKPLSPPRGQPAEYNLLWIDLAGVGFHLTRRQRIINLYQTLRYILPDDEQLYDRFLREYCEYTNWNQHKPENVIRTVKNFLHHKLETHPQP